MGFGNQGLTATQERRIRNGSAAEPLSGEESQTGGTFVCSYQYTDAEHHLLATKLRFADPKGFGWNPAGTKANDLPLYRLPEVLRAVTERGTVWLVEGEKDADNVRAILDPRDCATTPPGEWQPHHAETLRGAHVYIVRDRDESGIGQDKAAKRARSLHGVAAEVKVFDPIPDHDGADVSDHLDLGYTLAELVPVAEQPRSVVASFKTVQGRSLRWIDGQEGWLARGKLSIQTGIEGVGKTRYTTALIDELTTSGIPVLVVAGEDGIADFWKPILELAGVDLDLVSYLDLDALGPGWNIRDGADVLEQAVGECGAQVLFFDALLDHLPGAAKGETAKDATFVRGALYPLKQVIRKLDVAAVMGLHAPKGRAAGFRDMVQLSQAFNAVTRIGWIVTDHPMNRDLKVAVIGKHNLTGEVPAREFEIVSRNYTDSTGRTAEYGIAVNVRESAVTIDDLFITDGDSGRASKVAEAADIIRLALSDGEWHPATPILEDLAAADITSPSTLTTARLRVRVETSKKINGDNTSSWRLRPNSSERPAL